MAGVIGEIRSRQVRLSDLQRQWIDREMGDWAAAHPGHWLEDCTGQRKCYLVEFFRLEDGEPGFAKFACQIQLKCRQQIYEAEGSGGTPMRALRHCLNTIEEDWDERGVA